MKKKILLFFTGLSFLITAAYLIYYHLLPSHGILEIKTSPETVVYLNGEKAGTTPFKKELPPQTIKVSLFSKNQSSNQNPLLEKKVRINPLVLTFLRYDFTPNKENGEILTLSKERIKNQTSLKVSSFPSHATVILDETVKGYTPIFLKEVPPGQHILKISLPHYQSHVLEVNLSPGYRLECQVDLAQEEENPIQEKPATTTEKEKVVILNTPTGWLRVREGPGKTFATIGKVYPQEEYPLLEEKNDWFKIRWQEENEGWIAKDYAKKINSQKNDD